MADTSNQAQESNLRNEIDHLRSQLESVMKRIDEKGHDITADMAHKIAREMEHCRHRAGQLRDAGQAGLAEVGDQVRQNPVASLAIAFGAGWLISCLFRHLR